MYVQHSLAERGRRTRAASPTACLQRPRYAEAGTRRGCLNGGRSKQREERAGLRSRLGWRLIVEGRRAYVAYEGGRKGARERRGKGRCREECVQTCGLTRAPLVVQMFALLAMTMLDDVNTINTWAEPHNANGVTPNNIIDSNDEPAGNNQQRMAARGY